MLASEVGKRLKGCNWVGVPFAGGMSEVFAMDARTINVNDLHRHVINLAWVMGHGKLGPQLYRQLRRVIFAPSILANAQSICRHQFTHGVDIGPGCDEGVNLAWAFSYFICSWMTRHGSAGTDAEFKAGISTRWNATGGDSAAHYQGAVRAINTLRRTLRRCNFTCLDFREFLAKCKDEEGHGIYVDAPWPDDGEKYSCKFSRQDYIDLRDILVTFRKSKVVIRFGDHPLIRELYPEPKWTWECCDSRTQANKKKAEALICNDPCNR